MFRCNGSAPRTLECRRPPQSAFAREAQAALDRPRKWQILHSFSNSVAIALRPNLLLPPNDRTRSRVCTSSDELSRGTIAECLVRVNLVVVGDPARQLDADVVAFEMVRAKASAIPLDWSLV